MGQVRTEHGAYKTSTRHLEMTFEGGRTSLFDEVVVLRKAFYDEDVKNVNDKIKPTFPFLFFNLACLLNLKS